jgi:multimeric flavodoxin WrbA
VVKDDFQAIDEKLIASDLIVLAAPLFFANLPAQMKALVDRSQCQWVRKFLLHAPLPATATGRTRRRGLFLCVAGSSREEFKGVTRTVKYFFDLYETDYWGELLLRGIDANGGIDTRALQAAFNLGVKAVKAEREKWNAERGRRNRRPARTRPCKKQGLTPASDPRLREREGGTRKAELGTRNAERGTRKTEGETRGHEMGREGEIVGSDVVSCVEDSRSINSECGRRNAEQALGKN